MIRPPCIAATIASIALLVAGCTNQRSAPVSVSSSSRAAVVVSPISLAGVREKIRRHQGKVVLVHLWALW